jgi:hypothetical protein
MLDPDDALEPHAASAAVPATIAESMSATDTARNAVALLCLGGFQGQTAFTTAAIRHTG